jgi:hypothetical protein
MRRLLLLISLCFSLSSITAFAQTVWFAPPDNLQRGAKPPINEDFPHLFDRSPAWSAQADVFLISPFLASVSGLKRLSATSMPF